MAVSPVVVNIVLRLIRLAFSAAIINAGVMSGQNVLITGIGGGVALIALQLCIARGANVFVSSSTEAKIEKAIALGAKGGVNYKSSQFSQDFYESTLS